MAVMTVQGIEDDHSAEHKGDEDLIAKYQRVFQEQVRIILTADMQSRFYS